MTRRYGNRQLREPLAKETRNELGRSERIMPDGERDASGSLPPPAATWGFIAREIDRVGAALREPGISPCRYARLYAVNQALSWR